MTRREDALEAGLRALAEDKDIEGALSDWPDLRNELLPLLSTALEARRAAAAEMPDELKRRLRSRFLQRASRLRARPSGRRQRIIPAFPRTAIVLAMVVVLVLSSTGLVRASSTSVPGDQLYSVKRSWEDIRLLLSAQPDVRYLLLSEFEQERLDEIEELLVRGRSAPISFSGVVSLRQNGDWIVSGIPVSVPPAALSPGITVLDGQPVMVSGTTRGDGTVEALQIRLLQQGVALPPLGPSVERSDEDLAGDLDDEPEGPQAETPASGQPSAYTTYEFTGIVERMGQGVWQVNQQPVRVSQATIMGLIKVGSEIRFEGYYAANGTFVATRIEVTANLRHDEGDEDYTNGPEAGRDSKSEDDVPEREDAGPDESEGESADD